MPQLTKIQAAMARAVLYNDIEEVEAILKNDEFDVNFMVDTEFGKRPLISHAIHCGNIDMVKLLLARHPVLNESDKYGNTPLNEAVLRNRVDIVEALLDAGADVNEVVIRHVGNEEKRMNIMQIAMDVTKNAAMFALLKSRGAGMHEDDTKSETATDRESFSSTESAPKSKNIVTRFREFIAREFKVKEESEENKAERGKNYKSPD